MFLIVHNPLSSNNRSKRSTNRIVKFFKKHEIPFRLKSTLKIESLNKYLETAPKITDVLFVGGDGSINYLINHADLNSIKQNIYLAKSGSGNDFLRSLEKEKKCNVTIGLAKTNNGEYKFINGAGIGIDSLICHYVDKDINKNKLSYMLHFFKAVVKYRRMDFKVTVDGKEHVFHKGYLVAIQNGKYFGGGMKVTPEADIKNDEYILCIAHNLNNFLIQMLFVTIYFGWHKYIKKRVTFLKGKEINIKVENNQYMQTDGEVIDDVNEINITKGSSRELIAFNKKEFKKTISKKFHS